MSQKPNPTSIGLFIVVGVALGVIGLLLFSSSKIFTQTLDCIIYFDQSLNGLKEGAPVKVRGVTIGSVKRVMVRYNEATNDLALPVIITLDKKMINERLSEPLAAFTGAALEERVRMGLRASLQAESLVTGVLYVELRFNPNARPPNFHQLKPKYPEIPTEPTQIQALMENLASLDIKAISTNINNLIVKLDSTVGSMRMGEITAGITNTLASANKVLTSPEITNTLASARTTLDQLRALGDKIDAKLDPLADSVTNSLAEANRTLAQLRGTADNLKGMLRPDSPLQQNLDQLLRQLAGTAESTSALLEFLREHPNALITGREMSVRKP